jgi:long-chain acyl-CoA synthetase
MSHFGILAVQQREAIPKMSQLSVKRLPFRNMPALLRHTAQRVGERRFIREIDSIDPKESPSECSFAQFEREVAASAEFLARAGLEPFDRILFFAENSRDYQVFSLAVQALRAEPCSVFANLGPAAAADIAMRVKPKGIFVSTQAQWDKLAAAAPALIAGGLRWRFSPRPLAEPLDGLADHLSAEVFHSQYSIEGWNERVDAVGSEDPFLLLFTSGTSGKQKGVTLRQDAFVRSVEGGRAATGMSESDDGLMFLPFAHVAGQCQFMLAVALGHSLILVARRQDLSRAFAMGPTYAFAVPMVYERLFTHVSDKLAALPRPVRSLMRAALDATQRPKSERAFAPTHGLLRLLARQTLGRRLKTELGGNLRMLASGGASASPSLGRFFEDIGIPFITLYGMSETCGLICSQGVDTERHPDSVGLPTPDLELKLDSTGELLVKGPLMMQGYIESEDNESAFDEAGYFRTGDLAMREPSTGQYRLVGRSKNLLVLSTGKKISPEPIETELQSVWPLAGSVLLGDGRPYVSILLFVPGNELAILGPDEASAISAIRAIVVGRLSRFSDYERPKRFLVVEGSPSERAEFVTPTFKLKRKPILDAFPAHIDRLYSEATGVGFCLRS